MNFYIRLKKNIKLIYERIYYLPFIEKPLPRNPFGKNIQASKTTYLELHKLALANNDYMVKKFEEKFRNKIDLEWWSNLALFTQVVIKPEELNFFHGRLLYSVLCDYIDKNNFTDNPLKSISIFETGTARGFSSICMAKALNDKSCQGFITTIDCIPHNKEIYWNCISDHHGKISRSQLLEQWSDEISRIIFIQGWTNLMLKRIGLNRINFAFLDAQHTKESVIEEFLFVSKRQKSGDIIVFDDVTENIFPGVCEAVNFIKNNYPYQVQEFKFTSLRGYAVATKK